MSTSFEDILGATSPTYLVPNGSPSGSYFPSFDGLKMEENLDFSPALAEYDVLGQHFHDGHLVFDAPAFVGAASPAKSEKEVSPTSFLEEEDEEEGDENPKWELELEQLISDFDGEVPIDPKLKQELLGASVKDFNRRTKTMKLDPKTVQYLKLQRKRMKNRQAAIRSRTRKETRVTELQGQVDQLQREKFAQQQVIRQLQARTEQLEKELAKARAAAASSSSSHAPLPPA